MLYDSDFKTNSEDGGDSGERRRQKLVVHGRDGKVAYGFTLVLNRHAEGFNLEVVDKRSQPTGQSIHFQFRELKAVFYVKSYDGRFDPGKYDHTMPADGVSLVLTFEDGETMKGYALGSNWTREPRFFFVPEDAASNNIGLLVERTATKRILPSGEYQKLQQAEVEAFISQHAKPGTGREELLGDFHFASHNYAQALRHYREVREKEDTVHIRKKLCAAKYNVAVCHIRQRDYQRALRCMELVLELDPTHEQALQKVEQLREHLAKHRH